MASLDCKKRPLDDSFQTPPSKKAKIRHFNESWKTNNDWLRFDKEAGLMFCDLCIKIKNSNPFTSGSAILKKDSVTKHAKTKEHIKAEEASKQSSYMKTARETTTTKSESAITSALKNVYFAAKQNMASSTVPALNALCINQGVTQLSDLRVDSRTTYEHNESVTEFQEALSDVLRLDISSKIKNSGKFSLMLDESTDISVHQNLIIYIRLLERDCFGTVSPQTYYLAINQLERANSESIYLKTIELLGKKGIKISELCGISTDGASVMTGHKSGVVTRFKTTVPGILATHCIAHRLALSCCSSADTIPYLVKFQEILNSIYKYFKNSSKNMATLSAIQNVLQGQTVRFKEVFHTRWLSFEGSVDALVKNYSSLLSVFLEESSGKALSLYKPISTYKFLYVAHFLCDALKPLAILSKMYQKKDLTYSEISPLLSSTIDTLEGLRDNRSGHILRQFLKVTPQEPKLDEAGLYTFEFDGHTVRDSQKQRTESHSICSQFVDGMVKNLNSRFSDNSDGAVLTSMSNLFDPLLKVCDISGDLDTVSEYLDTIGFEGSRTELTSFANFSRASHNNGNKSVTDISSVANLAIKNKDSFPASAEVAERLLVLPVSTADCERGFSKQNIIKTSLRNGLSEANLDNLMLISIEGPEMSKFDFESAFKMWSKKKTRCIL